MLQLFFKASLYSRKFKNSKHEIENGKRNNEPDGLTAVEKTKNDNDN